LPNRKLLPMQDKQKLRLRNKELSMRERLPKPKLKPSDSKNLTD